MVAGLSFSASHAYSSMMVSPWWVRSVGTRLATGGCGLGAGWSLMSVELSAMLAVAELRWRLGARRHPARVGHPRDRGWLGHLGQAGAIMCPDHRRARRQAGNSLPRRHHVQAPADQRDHGQAGDVRLGRSDPRDRADPLGGADLGGALRRTGYRRTCRV